MVVFSIFFGNLASVPSDGIPYPLFSLAGPGGAAGLGGAGGGGGAVVLLADELGEDLLQAERRDAQVGGGGGGQQEAGDVVGGGGAHLQVLAVDLHRQQGAGRGGQGRTSP